MDQSSSDAATAAAAATNLNNRTSTTAPPLLTIHPPPQQQQPSNNAPEDDDDLSLPELRERARQQVQDAIHNMPAETKQAYLHAMRRCPELVQRESDPLRFVRHAEYNIWDAAHRLVLHWHERLEAFGPDRAFCPLNLSGHGALTQKDVLSLKAGFPAVLPRAQCGLQVLYCDRRQWIQTADTNTRTRSLFYLFYRLAQDDRAQTDGILCLVLLVMPRVKDYDRPFVQKAAFLAKNAFPITFHIHVLNRLPKTTTKRYLIQDLIAGYSAQLLETGLGVEVHIEREEGQLVQELQDELGLSVSGIPQACGGTWKFDAFAKWCLDTAEEDALLYQEQGARISGGETDAQRSSRSRNHDSKEERKVAATNHLVSSRTDSFRAVSAAVVPTTATAATAATTSALSSSTVSPSIVAAAATSAGPPATTEEERARRRRAVNAMHSRRKRDRRRQELQDMKTELAVLQTEQSNLQTEQVRLEDLLQQALEEERRYLMELAPVGEEACESAASSSEQTSGQCSQERSGPLKKRPRR